MLSAVQKDGKALPAADIYKSVWRWLADRGCAHLVPPDTIERYAMSAARWIQCEEAITEYGFLAKHPTTGNAIASPYVTMANNFKCQSGKRYIIDWKEKSKTDNYWRIKYKQYESLMA